MISRRRIGMSLVLAAVLLSGCHGMHSRKNVAASEPALDPLASGEGGELIVQDPPQSQMTWVDRHPLFSKPKYYYQNSGNNKLVKGAAATVVGVPAGIVGEMKQIVVGRPANPAPY